MEQNNGRASARVPREGVSIKILSTSDLSCSGLSGGHIRMVNGWFASLNEPLAGMNGSVFILFENGCVKLLLSDEMPMGINSRTSHN